MQNVKLLTDFWQLLDYKAGRRCFIQQEVSPLLQITLVWIHRVLCEPLAKQQRRASQEKKKSSLH